MRGNYGAVAYNYQIGEYDVTAAQYCQFLNAVAATNSDPYGLWNSGMSTDASGGINCSGSAGDYTYTVKTGHANNPAIYITWYDALRFANWLDNGQQNGNTETGVYTLTGSGPDWTVTVPSAAQRAAWAASYGEHWLLESYNEGYKAAFYKGGGTNAGYWTFATQSNTQPTSQAPPGGTNSANYCDSTTGFAVTGSYSFDSNQNYLTDVGAYTASPGPYGTFDQDGDAAQWTDAAALATPPAAYILGGDWYYGGGTGMSTYYISEATAASPVNFMGFRVVSLGLGYIARRCQRRRQGGHQRPDDRADQFRSDRDDLEPGRLHRRRHGGRQRPDHRAEPTSAQTAGAGIAAVPEPAGVLLLGIGAAGLLGYGWRRRRT